MNNLQRLQMEVSIPKLTQEELTIYLQENDLQPFDEYKPYSATNKKNIYQATLSVLESIANSPSSMKVYKMDDVTINDFHDNLRSRIYQLDTKIRKLKTDEQIQNDTSFFMLFRD